MISTSNVKIICKVFDDINAPEYFESYTIDNTSFYFSLSWNENFTNRSFYSNDVVVWDFGDGTTYTGASAKHFYKFPDIYNVSATIFDKNGEPNIISLDQTLTASNIFPDYVYLHPFNSDGSSYLLPSGKPSKQIIVTRYNSWQNEEFLKDNNYTINLYVSGSKSDYMGLSSYYSNKYSHLKAYHGFVNVFSNDNNYLQSKLVETTKTDSVSVYAVPYTTGLIDGDWSIKLNFYNKEVEGSSFVGSSGTNFNVDYVYFVDQKPSGYFSNEVDIIYASFDSKNFNEKDIEKNNLQNNFKKLDQGYFNLPWSGQVLKSIFNSADNLRITSNGISVEGNNSTIGSLSGQILYSFDIYPIKWTNTKIPFVITFKDVENYTVKTYDPIYNFHSGTFNNNINDINLKLVKYVNSDLPPIELTDASFEKNEKVPQYNNSPYFAGTVKLPCESETVAISATVKIQDTPVSKNFTIYGFLAQIGLPKVKRYEKVNVLDHSSTSNLEFYYDKHLSTLSETSTANMHICFSPLKYLDNSKENRVFILDADNERIFKTDVDGNIVSTMSLSSMQYQPDTSLAPTSQSFLNSYGMASPVWCVTDKNGNAYVSLADATSAIKINYETDIVSVIYYPPFENLEFYDPEDYLDIQYVDSSSNIIYRGFVGENTVIPSCIDVDSDNNVYIAYTHPLSNFICKFKNNGTFEKAIYFNPLEVPQEIIIDANKNIWVGIENIKQSSSVNSERDDLVYFIDKNTFEKTAITGIQGLGTMSIDSDQNVYVLHKTNTVSKIDAITKIKSDYTFGYLGDENYYLKDVGGIAVDSSGELWVVNNADGFIYFADTKNLSTPLSAIPSEKLKDLSLRPILNIQAVYAVLGDWTGFRWINKFIKTEIPEPRIITGMSSYFDILNPRPTVIKLGEEFDYLTQIKSYILQESLFDRKVLLDDFIGQILGKNENIEEIGKVIYEKISNFVANNSDIETCNIQQLISFADETGTNLNEYLYSYPPSIRRAIDLLSICHKKLFGTPNSYNRNFALSSYRYLENNNLGREIDINDGYFVAGKPIVTYELFSENYQLITNTIVDGYNFGENVPLSGVNYNWGWNLVTGTREQSGYEISKYYKFYEHVPNKKIEIKDNIINFDSDFTTITPYQSSFNDWSKFGGYMDKIISYGFYKGLKLIGNQTVSECIIPSPTPTPSSTATPTPTITPTPTFAITSTMTPTPTPTPTPTMI